MEADVIERDPTEQVQSQPRKRRMAKKTVFPEPEGSKTQEGYQRPDEHCYVPTAIAKPIRIEELSPLWRIPENELTSAMQKHKFLATLVIMVAGEFYVRHRHNGRWSLKKKATEVKATLFNEWGGEETKLNIRKSTIDEFMEEREFPMLEGTAYIPGAGTFVEIGGQRMLNLYYEKQLAYPRLEAIPDSTIHLVEMLVLNLIGHKGGSLGDWMNAVEADSPTEIKWVFHWLASLYQRPGLALPTALWFVGKAQGVGKSQFTAGLVRLLGKSNVKHVSAEEFKSDWTDFVDGWSLFLLDEVDFSSRKQAYAKTKRLIGNSHIPARKRGVGDYEIPAVGNFVFTTNNTQPLALEPNDRRHTFFETNGSPEASQRAAEYYRLSEQEKHRAWQGLAQLLAAIKIDDGLISKAFDTPIKERMIDANIDPFVEWLTGEQMDDIWRVGEFAPRRWLQDLYVEWAKKYAYPACATTKYFNDKMNEAVSGGMVSIKDRKAIKGEGKPWGHVRLDPDELPSPPPMSDCPPVAMFAPRPSVRGMRQKIEKQRRG